MRGNDCYMTDSDWSQRRAKDVWGGHARASDRKLWFNGGDGIPVLGLTTTLPGELPSLCMQQSTPIVPVPLWHLWEGDNSLAGICRDQIDGFHWGQ